MNNKKQVFTKENILFFAGLLLLEALFIWRAFRGFNMTDDMYIVSTSERIFRGDAMMIDEWQPSQQLTSFLMIPIYALVRNLIGSTEGIVMAWRFVFLTFHLITALVIYHKLEKKPIGRIFLTIAYLAFVPFAIYTMSYNTVQFGLLPMLLACIYAHAHRKWWEYILYGMIMAAIVLTNPYAITAFAILGVVCAAVTVYGRCTKNTIPEFFRFKNYILMGIGAAFLAALFIGFVLSGGSLSEVIENLPYVLSDSEHTQKTIGYMLKEYIRVWFKYYRYLIVQMGVLYAVTLLDRGRMKRRGSYLVLGSIFTGIACVYFTFFFDHMPVNFQVMPLSFLGLEAYILTEKKDKRLMQCWYVPAFLYTFVAHLGSNTGILKISTAYGVMSLASILILWDLIGELKEEEGSMKKVGRYVAILIIALHIFGALFLRVTFTDAIRDIADQNVRITEGPLKGVYTTPGRAEKYETMYRDVTSLGLTADDRLMVIGTAPWLYLCTDAGVGSWSTWTVRENSVQLWDYFTMHHENLPRVVYAETFQDEFMNSQLSLLFIEKGYYPVYLESGHMILTYDDWGEQYRLNRFTEPFEAEISDDEAGGYCLSFSGKIDDFKELTIGKGRGEFVGMYLNLTEEEIQIFTAIDENMIDRHHHNLQIRDFVNIDIYPGKNGEAKVVVETKDGEYEKSGIPWTGWQGSIFADPKGSTFHDCEFSYSCDDWSKDVWMFGDSYFAANRNDRWTYYLLEDQKEGYLLNAWPGRNSAQAMESLKNCLKYGTPKKIVWCLGMNDGSDETAPAVNWMKGIEELEQICRKHDIELILGTIPNVPTISNRLKNEYIRESGYRYIDFANAVGSEEDDAWYPGMLEEGELRVHPTKAGAEVLYEEAKPLLGEILP